MSDKSTWQARSVEQLSRFFDKEIEAKAFVLTGSLAAENVQKDVWSDVDVKIILTDDALDRYYLSTAWLAPFGKMVGADRHIAALPSPTDYQDIPAEEIERIVDVFWFKAAVAITKMVRDDWLIGLHQDGRNFISLTNESHGRIFGQILMRTALHNDKEWAMYPSDKPQRHPDATHETVEDEAIIINLNTGVYYTANDTATMFWELMDGRRTIGECARLIAGEQGVGICVSFSPDGAMLAAGNSDKVVRLWHLESREMAGALNGHEDELHSVSFSPTGSMLASASEDGTVRLWDLRTKAELTTLRGHTEPVFSVAFSSDGTKLASGSEDGTVRQWNVATGNQLSMLRRDDWVFSVAFAPGEAMVAFGSADKSVYLWHDLDPNSKLLNLAGHRAAVYSVAVNSAGKLIASGSEDRTIRLWELETGVELAVLQGHSKPVQSVEFNPDGTVLASGSEDHTIRLWDVKTGQELTVLHGHRKRVTDLAFDPNGLILASGSGDGTVRLWDVSTGEGLAILGQGDLDYSPIMYNLIEAYLLELAQDFKSEGLIIV